MVLLGLVFLLPGKHNVVAGQNSFGPGGLDRAGRNDYAKRQSNGNHIFLLLSSSYSSSDIKHKGFVLAH